jgi:ABC-type branched-subunit amino acid transport system ATPase component
MSKPPLPAEGTSAYLWWSQGAKDEATARDGGLSPDAKELIRVMGLWARQEDREGALPAQEQLALKVARVFCPDMLRRKFR